MSWCTSSNGRSSTARWLIARFTTTAGAGRDAPHLLHRDIVAGDEHDRHAVPAGDQRVEPALAERPAVDPDVGDDAAAGVREQAAGLPGLRVIADEDRRVERVVEPLHHPGPLEAVADQTRARLEVLQPQVAHAAVRVVDDDLGGAAGARAADGGVDVVGHQLARAAVFGAGRRELIGPGDAADAFHVDRDEDFLPGLTVERQTRRACKARTEARHGARDTSW